MAHLVKSGSRKELRVYVNPKYSVTGPASLSKQDKWAWEKYNEVIKLGRTETTILKWKAGVVKWRVVTDGWASELLTFDEAMYKAYILYVRNGLYRG